MRTKTATLPEEVDKIIDLISDLNGKVGGDEDLNNMSDEQYDRLTEQINTLNINIYNHQLVSEQPNDRLNELTDIMTSMAQLDFSQKATVTDDDDSLLDYIATGLNLLSYKLQEETAKLKLYKNVFESVNDLVIVTDEDGIIRYVNKQTGPFLGYDRDELVGENADLWLNNKNSDTLFNFADILMDFDLHSEHKMPYRNIKVEILHKDQYAYLVNMSVSVLRNYEDDAEGFVFIIPNQSVEILSRKLEGLHEVLKELLGQDEEDISKGQYKETIKMIVEELEPMTQDVIN